MIDEDEEVEEIFKSRYCGLLHINCGGFLTFEKQIREEGISKNMYRCDKCHALINCIHCPSWKEYHGVG